MTAWSGKSGKSRLVPVHPELHGALNSALAYGDIGQGRIIEVHPTTAWRWVQAAVKRAEELCAIAPGKRIGAHALRHSFARHLLMNGIPINYLSRWLGHPSIQTTLIYLELVDTRQLLLPVTTLELAYRYRGLSSIRRWEIDHRSTGSIDEAETDERQESTGSGGGIRDE